MHGISHASARQHMHWHRPCQRQAHARTRPPAPDQARPDSTCWHLHLPDQSHVHDHALTPARAQHQSMLGSTRPGHLHHSDQALAMPHSIWTMPPAARQPGQLSHAAQHKDHASSTKPPRPPRIQQTKNHPWGPPRHFFMCFLLFVYFLLFHVLPINMALSLCRGGLLDIWIDL
ncbi:hypothetical protein I3843_15G085800 [Carya illinoinensis]|nr:hypothetical protein I3843_15G085800 [Carya illinoinensis]